ncbi:YetF domain-containing protein [Ruminiclostridium cellulolyticum]|uniref:YetF C-terminal domain-containing protein n=1 Tax=Ruminiclostridium cellulolyticum (strain ATCC 35319 / DSM 5812 / JCM 6584 / H10) TaxID=394503 RepID=B8I3Z6_RUMCH|nr:DUF421 domain-containing protein [Ruminiclostridium cellulolyticum]ACL76429.1 protein of unknown function DUF421 [Ruminiclostridium cellulolyticum H10]
MLVVFIRTLILYIVVITAMRIMGKRQIGQLQPFELAVAIMISELASIPMQNTGIPLVNGIIPILTMLAAQILISFISLKSTRARTIICGRPSVLISGGRIMEQVFRKELYTLNDLLEQLRSKDIYNIADVEYAILETSGQLSVIPKAGKAKVIREDLNLSGKYEAPAVEIIIDGDLIEKNLKLAKFSKSKLESELKKLNIQSTKDVFFACVGSDGQLFCQKKEKTKRS